MARLSHSATTVASISVHRPVKSCSRLRRDLPIGIAMPSRVSTTVPSKPSRCSAASDQSVIAMTRSKALITGVSGKVCSTSSSSARTPSKARTSCAPTSRTVTSTTFDSTERTSIRMTQAITGPLRRSIQARVSVPTCLPSPSNRRCIARRTRTANARDTSSAPTAHHPRGAESSLIM